MKIFLVIYNLSGAVVHTFGPVDQPLHVCMELAARYTMQAIVRTDIETLTFTCEMHERAPRIQAFIKPRRDA